VIVEHPLGRVDRGAQGVGQPRRMNDIAQRAQRIDRPRPAAGSRDAADGRPLKYRARIGTQVLA